MSGLFSRNPPAGGMPDLAQSGPYSGGTYQETPGLPPGCPGCLEFRWFSGGRRDVPTPDIHGRPGVSGLD
eukprot:387153-Pyramimonas_sp.AAC.1